MPFRSQKRNRIDGIVESQLPFFAQNRLFFKTRVSFHTY